MKNWIIILTQLFPLFLFGQINTEKYYRNDSTVYYEIIQLDSTMDAHRHLSGYHLNGSKASEFFDKNRIPYDTLKKWDEQGELYYLEIYSDTGYTQIEYFKNSKNINEIGFWRFVHERSKFITIYDSLNFDKYETRDCGNPCYERTGTWKTYFPNGQLKSEGKYLPMEFVTYIDQRIDSLGNVYYPKKKSFEMEPGIIYAGSATYLRDGKWIFYNENGIIEEEVVYENGLIKK